MDDSRGKLREIRIAARLDRLLQGVEVQDERVRAGRRHGLLAHVQREAVVELDGPEIREQERGGGVLADLEAAPRRGLGEHHALGPDTHRHAGLLRRRGEVSVDRAHEVVVAAGHRRDQERERQFFSHELDRRIDLGQVQLRQGAMREPDVVEIELPPVRFRIALDRPKVLQLPFVGRVLHTILNRR